MLQTETSFNFWRSWTILSPLLLGFWIAKIGEQCGRGNPPAYVRSSSIWLRVKKIICPQGLPTPLVPLRNWEQDILHSQSLKADQAAQGRSIKRRSDGQGQYSIGDSPGRAQSLSGQQRTFGSRLPCPNRDAALMLQQIFNISATSEATILVEPVPRLHKSPLSVVKKGRKIEEELVKRIWLSARPQRLNSAEGENDCGHGHGPRTPSVTWFQRRLAAPYIPIG